MPSNVHQLHVGTTREYEPVHTTLAARSMNWQGDTGAPQGVLNWQKVAHQSETLTENKGLHTKWVLTGKGTQGHHTKWVLNARYEPQRGERSAGQQYT